ncbi:MAG: ABC transporter ATP-binding protein [Lachnospira sp.]
MEYSIEVENLTKVYKLYDKPSDRLKEALRPGNKSYHRDFYALKDLSFKIKPGETIGFVGKNGSGKSTLLKLLTEVLTPTSGTLKINGKVSALLELGAGFNNEYTGIENIYLNGTIMGYSREEMDKKIDDIVKFADIGDYIYQPVKTYSSGMFVRLAFAVAINVEPDILIVDEALAVGDVRFQLKCMDKFLEFKKKGITILYVSHDVNSIKRFCTRAIWINEGHMEADGDVDTITDKYLDYLKRLDAEDVDKDKTVDDGEPVEEKDDNKVDIAEITSMIITNEAGEEVKEVKHGEKINVTVNYYVNDTSIKKPVIGVALLRLDNLYICGLNTLLDQIDVPWKKGHNSITLQYDNFNLVGGGYYFDVAVYDQTASVPFDYRTKYKEIFVKMGYIAEGIEIIPHTWSIADKTAD